MQAIVPPLFKENGASNLQTLPYLPISLLERRWLKALALDPRLALFGDDLLFSDDVEPLFKPEDVRYFDRYTDGDDYTDPGYIRRFRVILAALKKNLPLLISMATPRGVVRDLVVRPDYLEYSPKDDKFRLLAQGERQAWLINLGRVTSCELYPGDDFQVLEQTVPRQEEVELELTDERRALERVLYQFSDLAKRVERLDDTHYRLLLKYDAADRTEILIRVLAFGPVLRVTKPYAFIELVKERLAAQRQYEL